LLAQLHGPHEDFSSWREATPPSVQHRRPSHHLDARSDAPTRAATADSAPPSRPLRHLFGILSRPVLDCVLLCSASEHLRFLFWLLQKPHASGVSPCTKLVLNEDRDILLERAGGGANEAPRPAKVSPVSLFGCGLLTNLHCTTRPNDLWTTTHDRAPSFMASASQLRLSIGWTEHAIEAAKPVLHVPCWASPRHCPDNTSTLLSAAPTRPCSPFHLPPSLLEQNYQCSSGPSDESSDASSAANGASSASRDVVQERTADGGCSYCGLAITGNMTVYMGFDSRFCCEEHRCRGLSDEIRLQHWNGTDDFVDHVHEHAPSDSWSLALPRTECARVQ
jgi:hypothetical protein